MSELEFQRCLKEIDSGNKNALKIIYDYYGHAVYSYAFSFVKNKQMAEDICQDVFIKMWNKSKSYRKHTKHKGWIMIITKNTSIDYLRKYKREDIRDEFDIASNIDMEDSVNEKLQINVLKDLNLKEILEGKLRTGNYLGTKENSYTDIEETSIDEESSSIIYGKVIDVKSFAEDDLISSNIEIEVIKDYKNNISEGEKILLGARGGEVTLEEYIKNASEITIWRNEYDKVEDKSKKIIALDEGVPQYRQGEYVLVYVFKLNKEVYYSEKEERFIEPPTADYGAYSRLYVNPNTEEVYKYIYDFNSNELIKEHIDTLDSFENHN